ncbi:hydrogen peroxide-inducible genes activator [uncultured Tateyamaria sp.]|uniref:hydrogen peroxide-inducible genes activator n=1 Tax=uncultured Tateyamaria sp. TaxID=455651 RepID=UPI002622A404|nr:hydrogen peroxide-inducible genes activator [uncultured Tateyamaria sp.]
MKNITLRQLRYFEALAREGHFGNAADSCAISQPALSVQIRELEETLGLQLFERAPKQVRLTPSGVAFAARARVVLDEVQQMGEWAEAVRGGLLERLRLGVIPTIAPYLLPRLIGDLTARFPKMDIDVRETITPRLLEELMDGRLDAAIVALPVEEPSLIEVPLFTEEMVLVRSGAPDPPTPLSTDALSDMRLLLLEEGHCFRDQALSFCNINAARRRDGLDGSSLSTLVQMVGAGIGATLIPEMAIGVETRATSVHVSRFAPPAPTRTIGLIWRKANPMGNALREIAEVVRETQT